jgi:hypothetical protein
VRPPLVGGRVEEVLDHPELALPAHEGRLETLGLEGAPAARGHPERAEERNPLGLALELPRARLGVGDRRLGRALRGFADEHAAGLGGGLDPRRGVDEVAGHHAFADRVQRDGGAAGEDAHSRPQVGRSHLLTERGYHRHQVERSPDGPLGVVL